MLKCLGRRQLEHFMLREDERGEDTQSRQPERNSDPRSFSKTLSNCNALTLKLLNHYRLSGLRSRYSIYNKVVK